METIQKARKSPKYTITLPADVDAHIQAEVASGRLGGKTSRIIAKRLRQAYAINDSAKEA